MISTQITHASTPTETQFNFSMATKIGTLNEESINRCYQLVSSLMVALCTEQASTISQDRFRSLPSQRLCLDQMETQGVCEDVNAYSVPTMELIGV